YSLIESYGGKEGRSIINTLVRAGDHKPHKRPSDLGPLREAHRRYLRHRGFDPDIIAGQWQIQGTGPVSTLDGIDYRNRIFIPILWDEKEVSFQTRDITNRSRARYISCPAPRELTPHKNVLYGREADWGET